MNYYKYNPLNYSPRSPLLMFFSLVLITLAGLLFIGPIMGYLLVLATEGTGLMAYVDMMTNVTNYPEQRSLILGVQGLNSIGAFVIAPLIFQYAIVETSPQTYFPAKSLSLRSVYLTLLIVFSFMIVNSLVAEWNAEFRFPDFMAGFEDWARGMENQLKAVTEYLTAFDSTSYFILSVVVIAVIPAVGEELLFRGLLQNIFRKLLGNPHVAIWLAAFLFGALHFQFYGLVPRMLIGALFGYLYLWTGNLMIPIFAHFINNGLSLLLLFLYQKGITDLDVESTESFPLTYILMFSVLFVILLVYFRKYNYSNESNGLGSRV
jgi:membrane protease YdiL (CAAX protease family)